MMRRFLYIATLLVSAFTSPVLAQENSSSPLPNVELPSVTGKHGGSVTIVDGLRAETVVSQAGFKVYLSQVGDTSVSTSNTRGIVSLRVEDNEKEYRYDLLPNGDDGLIARVNLSKVAGRTVKLNISLVDVPGVAGKSLRYEEATVVPASEEQMEALAIATQKTCPVSDKPLGSMGDPVAVELGDLKVYVCCAGCSAAVKADPVKYAVGDLPVQLSVATKEDAAKIELQKVCPVMDEPLGSMGQPVKLMVGGKPMFLCCKGCIKKVKAEPAKYYVMVHGTGQQSTSSKNEVTMGNAEVRAGVYKVSKDDAPFIAAQKKCPVMDEPLDAMGGPYKVNADGKAVYICCPGCAKKIAAEPKKYLAVLEAEGISAPIIR